MDSRLLILSPVGLVLAVVLCRLAFGRPLTRRKVNFLLSLLLLAYFAATAGLGIFWVADQGLPIFDWHYLVGYVTLVLVIAHLALNWRTLMAFFRSRSPEALRADNGRRWRPALRRAGWAVGLALFAGVFYWLGASRNPERLEVTLLPAAPGATGPGAPGPASARITNDHTGRQAARGTPAPHAVVTPLPEPSTPPKPQPPPAAIIERQQVTSDGEQRMLADHYHHKTKHTRLSLLRDSKPLDWSARPDVFKAYSQADVIELPERAVLAGLSVGAAIDTCRQPMTYLSREAITLADLSTMLFMTNGVTFTLRSQGDGQAYLLRAAPSAGALYPTITYVVARNVEGLAPGLYHYAVDQHKLHRFRSGANLGNELAALVAHRHLVENAPVTFIFTSEFYRSSWKYRERAYRYCCLDCGHLVVQASLAATALGFGSKPIGRFDDARINALLDLNEHEEGALAILPIGHVAQGPPPETEPGFALARHELEGRTGPLLRLMHGSTYLALTGDAVRPLDPPQPVDKSHADLTGHQLPNELAEGDDLFSTILRRRSIRDWADRGMSAEQFGTVMHRAFGFAPGAGQQTADPSVEDNQALNLYVVVHEVEGVEPGVYYYRRADNALAMIRPGQHRSRSYSASLGQDAVGYAGAFLVMTIDLERLSYPDGDRGYRYAGLDAGMIGGRVYLETTALGLGCCGIGAFFDDQLADLIGVDPTAELVIYALAIGAKEGAEP